MIGEGAVYPWLAGHHQRLVGLREADRLPHALLVSGARHLGKRDFAHAMAGYVLCREPVSGERCGACANCSLLDAGTHPDLRIVSPEDSKQVKIDQVRDLIDWVNQTAQRGGYKAAVIHPAEQMNVNASNALLKSLEEPSDRTLLILVSDLPGRLLPTIRSRCQRLSVGMPAFEDALAWLVRQGLPEERAGRLLSIAGGAPLAALSEFDEAHLARRAEIAGALARLVDGENPLDTARLLAKGEPASDLDVVCSIFADAVRLKASGSDRHLKNKDLKASLQSVCNGLSVRAMDRVIESLTRERMALAGPSNPNVALLFESLTIRIHRLRGA